MTRTKLALLSLAVVSTQVCPQTNIWKFGSDQAPQKWRIRREVKTSTGLKVETYSAENLELLHVELHETK